MPRASNLLYNFSATLVLKVGVFLRLFLNLGVIRLSVLQVLAGPDQVITCAASGVEK
jgi:hypothetical protein